MITRRLTRPLSAIPSTAWTCPSCARASLLPRRRLPLPQRRRVHHVPLLPLHDTFSAEGVNGLFTPAGYTMGWTQYQTMIIDKLNELTKGEPTKDQSTKHILLEYARDPMNASLFNHASMAHNNHFFFDGLSTKPMELRDPRLAELRQSLEQTYGSIETLRVTFTDTANAMFGPGFVWLVWAENVDTNFTGRSGDWRILTTYNAGTPYPEAGYRQQGIDMNTANAATFEAYKAATNSVGSFGARSVSGQREAKIPPGGTSLVPVLCVNTWEHVYIYDYGVEGKKAFVMDWWEAIDWAVVEQKRPSSSRPPAPSPYR